MEAIGMKKSGMAKVPEKLRQLKIFNLDYNPIYFMYCIYIYIYCTWHVLNGNENEIQSTKY
ncbi:hypothetical protein RhiirA4_234099 [Rhizophagus irregularis]|uniref:Uncharacterized protein n=1 Tax=Rhizophagus irregularis TaxID=588596 RepID=A0A2I1GQA6_9GLOM|nr:hypothetical protein RhiirA4_234099 [Rhizophagus irregularis]